MRTDYPEELTDKTQILAIQLLIGALIMSAVFFAIIVIVFTIPGVVQSPLTGNGSPAFGYTYLTLFTVVLLAIAIPVSSKLYRNSLKEIDRSGSPIVQIRTAFVQKFAILEGVALLGLTIILLAATDFHIHENSLVWLNALPFLWLMLTSVTHFPTAERIKHIYTEFSSN